VKKIIIVEDDFLLQAEYVSFFKQNFGSDAVRIISLPSADNLLDTQISVQADLIITDLVMDADKEGMAGIMDIRGYSSDIPIIVISGYPSYVETASVFNVDVLLKPVNLLHLSALVSKHLNITPKDRS